MRWASALAVLGLAGAAPAAGAGQIASAPLHDLGESRGGAVAIAEAPGGGGPFRIIRSSGRAKRVVGAFGTVKAEFPSLAVTGDDRLYVSWALPVSGGAALHVLDVGLRRSRLEAISTGPGRLAAGDGALHLAYPDREGNAAVTTSPIGIGRQAEAGARALTVTAPERRHLPMDAADVNESELADDLEGGVLVLDLIQARGRTELRVVGPGAPAAPILAVPAVRHYPARMAVERDRIAVTYLDRGRARLAVARMGGTWSRRWLPGGGGGAGAPSPTYARGSLRVAYTQRGDVYLWSAGRLRRLTQTPAVERDALAAGEHVGWTRREPGRGAVSGWVQRVR